MKSAKGKNGKRANECKYPYCDNIVPEPLHYCADHRARQNEGMNADYIKKVKVAMNQQTIKQIDNLVNGGTNQLIKMIIS